MDFAEIYGGQVYGTMHWNNGSGGDSYSAVIYNGVDPSQAHTYSIDWEPGSVTFAVDGHTYGTLTNNVSPDAAHGGVNSTLGANNTSYGTSVTVYDVSYSASGAGASVAAVAAPADTSSASVAVAASTDGATDWNAIAAQVYANFEATGHWFI